MELHTHENSYGETEAYDRAGDLRHDESVSDGVGYEGQQPDEVGPGFTALTGLSEMISRWRDNAEREVDVFVEEHGSARLALEKASPRLGVMARDYDVDLNTLLSKSLRWLRLAEERLGECEQCVGGQCERSTGLRKGVRVGIAASASGTAVLFEERCPLWSRHLEQKRLMACGVPPELAHVEFDPAQDGVTLAEWTLRVAQAKERGQCFVNARTILAAERQGVAAVISLLRFLPRARVRYVDAHEARQELKQHFDDHGPDPLRKVAEADVAVITGVHDRTLPFVLDAVDQVLATRRRLGRPTAVVASAGKPDDVLSKLCSLRV